MKKKKLGLIIVITAVLSSLLTVTGLGWMMGFTMAQAKDTVRFFGAVQFIQKRYVKDVDYTQLIDGAINGMVKTLDDPHSIYLDQGMYKQLMEHTEGSFEGIGVVMDFRDKKITVISVLDDTPGQKAGIQAGDEILAVDGTPVTEIQPEEVAMRIRGAIGTQVTITIRREGEADQDYTITRDTIKIKTAVGYMLPENDDIGYIRIASFSENTGKEFKTAYDTLEKQGMKGLIIDLRENPGGLVTSCVEIANMVVPKGPIVSVVQRDGTKEEHDSKLESSKYPIVVLIDGNSASASEILAGALQDTGAGILVGSKSYGKGSVQVVVPLYDDDALKLTIAKYYTPSGRSIDGTGIEPDVKVDPDPKAQKDNQLAKAIEVMQEKLQ